MTIRTKSEASRKSLAVAFDQMILDDDKAFESNIGLEENVL